MIVSSAIKVFRYPHFSYEKNEHEKQFLPRAVIKAEHPTFVCPRVIVVTLEGLFAPIFKISECCLLSGRLCLRARKPRPGLRNER